jgi:hypothetical protein
VSAARVKITAWIACSLLGCAIGCGDGGHGAGSAAGSGGVPADAGHAGAGSGGEHGGAGGHNGPTESSGNGGSNGNSGSSAGSGNDAGDMPCTAKCSAGQHCELVQVACIRAPCPPQPTCVDDAQSDGKACGSRGLGPCAAGEFCNFPRSAQCGAADAPGTCTKLPQLCNDTDMYVCGCDGKTYSNECVANAAGVSSASAGRCESSDASTPGAIDCDPRKILCKRVAPECPEGQVPSVLGSCYGDCVPLESCPCSGPEQCPNPDTGTCHMSAGHCGPFV